MRLALVYHAMRLDAGVPKMHVQLARYLVRRGHDVRVYGSVADSDPALLDDVRFHDVGVRNRSGRLSEPWSVLRSMRRVDAALQADRPDVVHGRGVSAWTQDIVHVTGVYRFELAAKTRGMRGAGRVVRAVVRPVLYPMGPLRTFHERRLTRSERLLFHAETSAVADALTSGYGVAPERVRIVVPGVDVETFTPEGPREDVGLERPVIAFCGHDYHRKGLDRLLRALPRMRTRAGVIVIGGGRHLQAEWSDQAAEPFRRLAAELGIADRVRFLGARADVAPLLRAADVLAHPARFDVWALAVAEGMAAGLPVVVTETTGAAELVDGENGRVVGGEASPDELAAALDELLEPARRAEAGRLARETAARISVDRQGALVEEDMERILEEKRSRQTP